MAFVKEYRNVKDDFPEWEYLTKIGVRDMFGRPLKKFTTSLVVDRERNYYLIPRGHTNLGRDDEKIYFYALCLDGVVLNMEVEKKASGNDKEYNYECHWNIKKIKFPPDWTYKNISKEELIQIIIEAFTVETYSNTLTPEKVRALSVKVDALLDDNSKGSGSK